MGGPSAHAVAKYLRSQQVERKASGPVLAPKVIYTRSE